MRRGNCIALAVLLLSGCGESREFPTAPPEHPSAQDCDRFVTQDVCISRTELPAAVVHRGITVTSPDQIVRMRVPVVYQSTEKAEAFQAAMASGGYRYVFNLNHGCPVVPDQPGVNDTVWVELHSLTGLIPGQYVVTVEHGLGTACYDPPADADRSAENYLVILPGWIDICDPTQ